MTTLKDTIAIEVAIHRILRALTSLSSKVELVILVGYRKNSGHQLVSVTAAAEFETSLHDKIRATPAAELAGECNPLRILLFAKSTAGSSKDPIDIDDSPALTFSLLRSVHSEATNGSLGNNRTRRRPSTLDWKSLVHLYGSEDVLMKRIKSLNARFKDLKPWLESRGISLNDAEHLHEQTDKFLSGWQSKAD